MGTCLASTPIEHYWDSFQNIKVSEIEDYWTTFEVFKIKKIYDQVSSQHPDFPKHTHIEEKKFMEIFHEIEAFPLKQKQRFFQIFNYDGHGFVDWNNFFSMVSICYFASQETILTVLFLIFDESLSKKLTKAQLQLMVQTNESCIVAEEEQQTDIPKYTAEEVSEKLLKGNQQISLAKWIQNAKEYFDISKIRRIFSIFNEQKIEKQLIKNYSTWNNLYVESQERYVSYLISFKWFESWKIYAKSQYGVNLHSQGKKPSTFKSRKLIRNKQSGTNKKIAENLKLRQLKWEQNSFDKDNDKDYPEEVKNYDFVHSNFGEKPNQIYNNVLEGQYEQVLKEGLIENRDYILISEKVWKSLKKIYGGMPEFRRTGYDYIELYPKILKVLKYVNGNIDFSDGAIKQVSGYYGLQDIMEAIYNKEYVQKHKFFFKCIGMKKWQQIDDLSYALAEITSEVMVFLIAIPENQVDNFVKKRGNVPKDITEVNVGDFVKFQNPLTKNQQTMVIVGKNIEGKYILHIPGQSYIYDICVLENELFTKGKLLQLETVKLGNDLKLPPINEIKLKRKQEIGLVGIPNSKGLNFINSAILQLYHDIQFRELLLLRGQKQSDSITVLNTLTNIFKNLSAKKKVSLAPILDMVEQLFPDFQNFSANMCQQFINQLYKKISNELEQQQLKDVTSKFVTKVFRKTKCLKCNTIQQQTMKNYCVCLPLLMSDHKYYEIIFVPYNKTLKTHDIKKYGFKLSADATLKNYKDAFESIAGMELGAKYLLMEVYANNIVKNYSTAKNQAPLTQLMLRDTDTIVAYELQTDFQDFIQKHYSNDVDYENKEIRIDQFIDCKNQTRGWIFGKVCEKQYTPYGHRTMIKVIHKFSKGEQWEITYDVFQDTVAHFPTKSYLNGEQYHLRLHQRYFNQASNDMELCNMPLVVVLTNWMRWRQFYYMIYLQMKRFIVNDISNQEMQDQENYNLAVSTKTITSRKNLNKIKLNRFKEYLYGQQFPYKLNFVDYSGRCAICFKFLKSKVFPQEQNLYCVGCKLSKTEPLSWQIKVSDVLVCVDWKSLNQFKKDIVKDHSTYANMNMQRKNDVNDLQVELAQFQNGFDDVQDVLCCASSVPVKKFQQIQEEPDSLILHLDRVVQENGFIKTINRHVKFDEQINVNKKKYLISGVTSIQGNSVESTKYRTYIKYDEDQWIQYDGKVVKQVKKNVVDRACALNLYYKQKEIKQ